MKTLNALLCTALAMSVNFNFLSQFSAKKENTLKHVIEHIQPGMTQNQIDSLHAIAEKNHLQNDANLHSLILEAQKVNKTQNIYKSDACELANWGFENGNISNWATSGCVQLENGGMDTYGSYPKVFNGNHSLKLSNDSNYDCLYSAAARTYSVPASGQTFITIHFATNIFNYPHSSFDAAKFNFNLYDNQMNVLPCPTYQAYYASDEGPVGIPSLQQTPFPATFYNPVVAGDLLFNSNVSFSNWHHVTVDLSAYAGTDVTMVFENRWCAYDVDWIYTYIEVDCPVNNNFPIPVCLADGNTELCAPDGMLATYDWEFNDLPMNNTQQCITVDEEGTYTLNFQPVYLECAETSYELTFELIDKPVANFSVNEFCIGQPVIINNLSQFGSDFKWIYNGQEFNGSAMPSINYVEGEDALTLIASAGSCADTLIKPLIARKIPNPKFEFENQCVGVPYKIVNLSTDPYNGPLQANWTISTTYQSSNWNPQYTAENDQEFVIALQVTNQYGCSNGIQTKAKAFPLPQAAFNQSENSLSENSALVHFQDESSSDVSLLQWAINEQTINTSPDFYHEFMEPGLYNVSLIVMNEYACTDTAFNQIVVNPSITLYVPNTFTPNGDENNQFFRPVFSGSNFDRKNYTFLVFNRWGEVVFQTQDIQEAWDGFHNGLPCMQGTYSWEISYLEQVNKEQKHVNGHVNLVR